MAAEPTDPNDIAALKRQMAELQAKLAAAEQVRAAGERGASDCRRAAPTATTAGGAHVGAGVNTAGGHFIGRDFIQIINQALARGDDSDEAASVIAHYLDALAKDLAGVRLSEIDVAAQEPERKPLQLADIYVPLDTHLHIPEGVTLVDWLARDQRSGRGDPGTQRETRPVAALEALAAHRLLTILGKAGSGKSTFGASVLLALAQAWQGHPTELARLGESWTHGALLPIRIVLRRFAEQLPRGDGPVSAGQIWQFVGDALRAGGIGLASDVLKYIQRIARNHGALLLLDGLDECGSTATQKRVRAAVEELVKNAGEKCRFVLTARPYAVPEGPNPANGVYALADLNDGQIEQFIRAWYAALAERGWQSREDAARKMADLLAVRRRPDLLPLAQNPLLLTLMATLHANRGRLPDDRADLYGESVDLLILRWNRQIGADKELLDELAVPGLKLSDLREALEGAAFKVHEENIGNAGTADIGEDGLVRVFRPLLNNSKDKADVVIDYIEKRAGLLVGQGQRDGERQFTFPHRTFQEFLAACHLAPQPEFPAECARLARAAPDHWSVVLPLAARLAKAERGASAADELICSESVQEFRKKRKPDAADWACARLAGMQLQEIGASGLNRSDRTRAIAARVAGWLEASLPLHPDEGGEAAVRRAQAGDLLAVLGDPRFDPGRFFLPADDMFGFVRIAPDPDFRIGTRNADAKRVAELVGFEVGDDEINDKPTPTPEFYIGRYLVTVAQFRAFVTARQAKIGDDDTLRDPDSRPVQSVNWHEALKYCDWLNEQLVTSPALAASEAARLVRAHRWRVSLPSELEWEKAARGTLRDTIFPWGDEPDPNRANYADTGVDTTSAVGCFASNDFGLYDMSGNVWQWTRSRYESYPYQAGDGREQLEGGEERVVRGGSWDVLRDYARCAFRFRSLPDYHYYFIGFRDVLRSPPVL